MARVAQPDLLLLHVSSPPFCGLKVLRQLKADTDLPKVPVIVQSTTEA